MGKKDKFFGAVEEAVVEKELVLDNEVLAEVLSADDEVVVGATLVNEGTDEAVVNVGLSVVKEELPLKTLGYYRDPVTQRYQLVTIGYNPNTGEVGVLELATGFAMDRNSIEEEFKITAIKDVFNK